MMTKQLPTTIAHIQAIVEPDPKHCSRRWLFSFEGQAFELLRDHRFNIGMITGTPRPILIARGVVAPMALEQLDGYAWADLEREWDKATGEWIEPAAAMDRLQELFEQLRAAQGNERK